MVFPEHSLFSALPGGQGNSSIRTTGRSSDKLHGNGGHGSQPQTTNDPILAVSQLVVLLQQIVARNVDPNETAVLTVGLINGGTAVNIIPGEASCSGVSRFYNNEVGATIRERCRSIARGVESLSGCHIDVNVLEGYACVNNDTALISQIESSLDAELGPEGHFRLASPFSASEDFSAYGSTGLPLALMWLHGTPEGGTVYPLHHPKCTLKSDLIPTGAAGLCRIAVDYLRGPEV